MGRRSASLSLWCAALLGASAGSLSADAAKDFQELFGREAAKVAATAPTKDDAEFAAALLDAAKTLDSRKGLQLLVYEKAADFGARDLAGSETALKAMQQMIGAVPARREEWHEKLLGVYQFRFRRSKAKQRVQAANQLLEQLQVVAEGALARGKTGEAGELFRRALRLAERLRSPQRKEIASRLKAAAAGEAAARKRTALELRLKAIPDSVGIREALIRLYLTEPNGPAKAAKLLSEGLSEELRTYVPLAAKPVTDVPAAACLELARWFEKLAETAAATSRATALRRAGGYYQQFLSAHKTNDVSRLKAKVALSKIEKELAGTGSAPFAVGEEDLALELAEHVTLQLVFMPADSFLMGSPNDEEGREEGEGPRHLVTISKPFYVGVTEVTVGQFGAFAAATGYVTAAEKEGWANVMTSGKWRRGAGVSWRKCSFDQTPSDPVTCINWHDAVAFCQWLSKKAGRVVRLPTEAEWEYACRAGTTRRFHFGDDKRHLGFYAWYASNSGGRTHPVGRKRPNPAGLHDMMGHVHEWCSDWYRPNYNAQADAVDPRGPAAGQVRVRRGMAFIGGAGRCRSAYRSYAFPASRSFCMGFRVVASSRADAGSGG